MLNTITCDTEPSEIISMSDISSYLTEIDNSCKDYKNKIRNTIIEEQTSAGLSTKAYAIDNQSSLQEKSNQLLDNMEIERQWNNLKERITENLIEQRNKEIEKLLQKLTEKINELEQDYKSICSSIRRITLGLTSQMNLTSLMSQKESLEDEIKKYEQKKNTVEGMK